MVLARYISKGSTRQSSGGDKRNFGFGRGRVVCFCFICNPQLPISNLQKQHAARSFLSAGGNPDVPFGQ